MKKSFLLGLLAAVGLLFSIGAISILNPVGGGTGLSNPAAHGLLISEGTAPFALLTGTTGQCVGLVTSSDPIATSCGGTSTVASGTATMGTGAVLSGTCSSAVTVTATGVATTDTIIVTVNADPTAVTGYTPVVTGSLYVWPYPTSGDVNFKLCNNTVASITPSAITLNWRVVR